MLNDRVSIIRNTSLFDFYKQLNGDSPLYYLQLNRQNFQLTSKGSLKNLQDVNKFKRLFGAGQL